LNKKINDGDFGSENCKNLFLILLGCMLVLLLISGPAPSILNPLTIKNHDDNSLLQYALAQQSGKKISISSDLEQTKIPIPADETLNLENSNQTIAPLKEPVVHDDSELSDLTKDEKKDSSTESSDEKSEKKDSSIPTYNKSEIPQNNESIITEQLPPSINNTNVSISLQPSINNTNIQECQVLLPTEGQVTPNNSTTSELQLCKVVTNLNVDPSKLKNKPLDDASSFTLVVAGNNPSETQSVKANFPGSQISYTVIVKNGNYKTTETWGNNNVIYGKKGMNPICSDAGYTGTIIPPEGGHYSYCVKLSSDCAGTINHATKTCTVTNAAFE
jgi:hypothetical protein